MIHLCAASPFDGQSSVMLLGKGPSLDMEATGGYMGLVVGINHAALLDVCDWGIAHDWTTVRGMWALWETPMIVSGAAWFRPECAWVREGGNLYFDGRRVWGTDVPSQSVPGRSLGVGTATVALQLAAQAGVERVVLNGFDNFWGDDEPGYHDRFVKMGCDPEDYAREFPASGTPAEQVLLVRESMQYVIERGGVEVSRP